MNQTEKKKNSILKTTFQLLNEKAISAITVDEIAEKAEVSKVTIFKYYESKNKLMKTVIMKAFEHMGEDVRRLIASDLNFEETYKGITKMKFKQLERYTPQFTENLMSEYSNDPDFFDTDTMALQMQVYEELFSKGQREGKISVNLTQDDFMFILNIFVEGMKGLSAERLFDKTELITNFFINGLSK